MSPALGVLLVSGVRHQAGYAALLAAHPRLRLTALADEPDLPDWMDDANADLARRFGVPYVRDLRSALARDDVGVVSVCSEPTRHARLAALAAAAGKHVLVDKPLGLTPGECDEVASAAKRGGGVVTFVHRLFSPAIQRLRRMIDQGALGLPWAVHVTWLAAGGLGGATVERDELVVDPKLSGGGEMANFLGYPLGTIRYLSGLEVESVRAIARSQVHAQHRRFGVEDIALLTLTLQGGALATITVGRLAEGSLPGPGRFTIRVHGSHGSVVVDEERPRVRIHRAGRLTERSAAASAGGAGAEAIRLCVEDFVRAIDGDRQPLCDLADARALASVLQAAYASARSGHVEPIGS